MLTSLTVTSNLSATDRSLLLRNRCMYTYFHHGKHALHRQHLPLLCTMMKRHIPIRSETRAAHEPSKSLHTMGVQPSLDV